MSNASEVGSRPGILKRTVDGIGSPRKEWWSGSAKLLGSEPRKSWEEGGERA